MSWKTKTLLVVFGLIVLSGSTASRGEDSRDPSHFTYARLYCAPDGNTRFQDVTAELRKTNFAPPAPPIHIGSDFAASRAFFGGFDAGLGRAGPGKSPQPSYARNSIRHRPARRLFHHHYRRRDAAAPARQRVSTRRHLALQGL
jgi:hypothetical protein